MIYFAIGIHENAFTNTQSALSLYLLGAKPPDTAVCLPRAIPLGAVPSDPTVAPLAPTTNSWIRQWCIDLHQAHRSTKLTIFFSAKTESKIGKNRHSAVLVRLKKQT